LDVVEGDVAGRCDCVVVPEEALFDEVLSSDHGIHCG
jgi:hypothetical protein